MVVREIFTLRNILFVAVVAGVGACSFSIGRGKALANPIMRPILLNSSGWDTFIPLKKKALRKGLPKDSVEKYILKNGFNKTNAPYYQSRICRWLAAETTVESKHLFNALDECREAKLDIERTYTNRHLWMAEDGSPEYRTIVPDVYQQKHGEFPCNMDYSVFTFYDENNNLVEALGYRNEAGCL